MKTKFMAAVAACRLKARAFARTCLESKRNPYRFFRTAVAAIAVATITVPATTLLGGATFADSGSGEWHAQHACAPSYRISHGNLECVSAWWDNTPPASTGVAGGSTYGAENKCSDFGDIVANIDLKNVGDRHFHLNSSSKERGRSSYHNVRDITCCVDKSDFCYKQQVEKDNGKIKVWSGTGTTMDTVNPPVA